MSKSKTIREENLEILKHVSGHYLNETEVYIDSKCNESNIILTVEIDKSVLTNHYLKKIQKLECNRCKSKCGGK
ncbi:MAG: hypothetical protein RR904_06830 [Bacilli bacterium]